MPDKARKIRGNKTLTLPKGGASRQRHRAKDGPYLLQRILTCTEGNFLFPPLFLGGPATDKFHCQYTCRTTPACRAVSRKPRMRQNFGWKGKHFAAGAREAGREGEGEIKHTVLALASQLGGFPLLLLKRLLGRPARQASSVFQTRF